MPYCNDCGENELFWNGLNGIDMNAEDEDFIW